MSSIRYTKPTRYDWAPFGTMCVVKSDEEPDRSYVQLSWEGDSAQWETIGYLLEYVLQDYTKRQDFIDELLRLYVSPQKEFLALGTILALKKLPE